MPFSVMQGSVIGPCEHSGIHTCPTQLDHRDQDWNWLASQKERGDYSRLDEDLIEYRYGDGPHSSKVVARYCCSGYFQ